jgi:hypothetical protein
LIAVEITPVPSALVKMRAIARFGAGVGEDLFRMDEAGDGISELGFVVANAVAANHGACGFDHFREAAGEDAFENVEIGLLGKTHQGQRCERFSAHRVNIAQRIGRGDLAECVGIVDDRSEEIDGLNERLVGCDLIHSGVVGVVEAD